VVYLKYKPQVAPGLLDEVKTLSKTNKTEALNKLKELQLSLPETAELFCEEAVLLVSLGNLDSVIGPTQQCWEKAKSNKNAIAERIITIYRSLFLRSPLDLKTEEQAELLLEASRLSKNSYGMYLASKCKLANRQFDESGRILKEALEFPQTWTTHKQINLELIDTLLEQQQNKQCLEHIESLYQQKTFADAWRKDPQLLEYYGVGLLRTSESFGDLQSALTKYENRISAFQPNETSLGYYYFAELNELTDNRNKALEIKRNQWELFWRKESKESLWNCTSPQFILNWTEEKPFSENLLPEQTIAKKILRSSFSTFDKIRKIFTIQQTDFWK